MNAMNQRAATFLSAGVAVVLLLALVSPLGAKNDMARTGKAAPPKRAVSTAKQAPQGRLQILSADPYRAALLIDAEGGAVLFEDGADRKGYPASMVKLMNFLLILEAVEARQLSLKEKVLVTVEAAKIGGSQVYLKEGEVFSVDDLLYALMVQSANDAATALAIHYQGSKEAFVDLMNRRAREMGMKDTVFHSVHGLPPGRGQLPDVSTPRDMALLSREVLRHPRALQYTATKKRLFRTDAEEPFVMENHNQLLGRFEGCDGLKTGYFRAAGFSIAATAEQGGQRVIAIVMGSVQSATRDNSTKKLLLQGLRAVAAGRPPSDAVVRADQQQ